MKYILLENFSPRDGALYLAQSCVSPRYTVVFFETTKNMIILAEKRKG